MTFEYQNLIPSGFDENSRVWIYQSDRSFTSAEIPEISGRLSAFCRQWHSHGNALKSHAQLFFNRFVVLMADERKVEVSGCSMDNAVSFLRELEREFNTSLLNRQLLSFIDGNDIMRIPMSQLRKSVEEKIITPDTLYFNNSILTLKDFREKWIIPVRGSWLFSKIKALLSSADMD